MVALVLKVIRISPHQRHPDFAEWHFSRWLNCPLCRFAFLFASLQFGHVRRHTFVGCQQILGGLQHLRVVRWCGRTGMMAEQRGLGRWRGWGGGGGRWGFRIIAGGQELGGTFAHFDFEVDLLLEVKFLCNEIRRYYDYGLIDIYIADNKLNIWILKKSWTIWVLILKIKNKLLMSHVKHNVYD